MSVEEYQVIAGWKVHKTYVPWFEFFLEKKTGSKGGWHKKGLG